jgi:hypothetical protein
VNVCPEIEMTAVRLSAPVLAAAVYLTVPSPVPAITSTVTQVELWRTVHAQPAATSTPRLPVPPEAETCSALDNRLTAQVEPVPEAAMVLIPDV